MPTLSAPQVREHHLSAETEACIANCLACHHACLEAAMNHCLEMGGAHLEKAHVRLMRDCAEICQTAANFMLSSSRFHGRVCGVCAEVCDACADSCETLDGMADCARACRACAESCSRMAAA